MGEPGRDTGATQSPRSRSPGPRGSGGAASRGRDAASAAWSTDRPALDEWLLKNVNDNRILERLAEAPVMKRRNWVLQCMERKVTNPDSWLAACLRNFAMDETEKRLTGIDRFGQAVRGDAQPVYSGDRRGVANVDANSGGGPSIASSSPPSQDVLPKNPPSWAKRTFAFWPSKKSELVGAVMENLNREEQETFGELDPPTMAALAYALVLAVPDTPNGASAVMKEWLKRRDDFRGLGSSSFSASDSGSGSMPPLEIQMIVVGNNDVRGTLLATLTTRIISKMSNVSGISFSKPMVFSGSQQQTDDIVSLEKSCGFVESREERNFCDLEAYLARESEKMVADGRKVLVIAILPPAEELMEFQADPSCAALHLPEARWIFELSRHIEEMNKLLGSANVASVMFSPSQMNENCQKELANHFGPKIDQPLPASARAANHPDVYAFPKETVWTTVLEPNPIAIEFDGWKLKPDIGSKMKQTVNMATKLVSCLVADMFKERPLSDDEKEIMTDMKATHRETGERRALSREWWLGEYNLTETPLPSFWREKFKCAGTIISASGLSSKAGGPGTPCGQVRYCMQCEKVLKMLDEGYNMHSLVNGTVNVIMKAVSTWRRKTGHELFQRSATVQSSHHCGDDCVHYQSIKR